MSREQRSRAAKMAKLEQTSSNPPASTSRTTRSRQGQASAVDARVALQRLALAQSSGSGSQSSTKSSSKVSRSQSSSSVPSSSSSQKANQKSAAKKPSREEQRKKDQDDASARSRKNDEIYRNAVLYLTCTSGNKIPIKKSDFIKRVFGSDKTTENFQRIMKKVKRTLKDVFGYKVWGYNDGSGEISSDISGNQAGFNLWLIVSEFPGISLILSSLKHEDDRDEEDKIRETKQAILVMFLTIIFMQNGESGVEESQLWSTITEMGFDDTLSLAEKDFKKFLKKEYVTPMYLKVQEQRNEQQGVTVTRYIWGIRANLEMSRWNIFKHAVQQFPGTKPADFPAQLQIILNSEEKVLAKTQLKNWERYENGDTSSSEEVLISDNEDYKSAESGAETDEMEDVEMTSQKSQSRLRRPTQPLPETDDESTTDAEGM